MGLDGGLHTTGTNVKIDSQYGHTFPLSSTCSMPLDLLAFYNHQGEMTCLRQPVTCSELRGSAHK